MCITVLYLYGMQPGWAKPRLRFIVYRRCPEEAAAWVREVAKWPFKRIVPAHLQAFFFTGFR